MSCDRPALLLACRRDPRAAEVAAGLDRAGVPAGAGVLVAVSGGADSVALLGLAAGIACHGRVAPIAGHVDHGLRPESPLDRDAAAEAAERVGVRFLERRLALAAGPGVAARAREARYRALAEMAAEAGVRWVLTAHHADDQAETVLLALARGAGLDGMSGMAPSRALPDGLTLGRPCLRIRREALREACLAANLRWREDPGNDRADTPRGRIRHGVIPVLEAIAPGAAARIARGAEVAREGAAALHGAVAAAGSGAGAFPRSALRCGSPARAATAIRMLVGDRIDDAMLWKAADAACDAEDGPRGFALQGGGTLVVDARSVRLEPQGASSEPRLQRE